MKSPFVIEVPHPRYFLDDHCANCLAEIPIDIKGLFCSSWCREIASQVRYLRRVSRDGRIDDPLVQYAVQTKNAFLLAGGYAALGRRLTTRIRAEVRVRDAGHCQTCGKPGTEVDHIAGNSDDLSNLQLLCDDCHHAKTAKGMVPASEDDRLLLLGMMATRVAPDDPQLLADDEQGWNEKWRSLQAARKCRFERRLREAGIRVRQGDNHATLALALIDALESQRQEPEAPQPSQGLGSSGDPYFDVLMRDVWR